MKELAVQYMEGFAATSRPSDKFPVPLGPMEQVTAMLLGAYGAAVGKRGVSFRMDDNTLSKVEKFIHWMYSSNKRGLLLSGTLGNGKTTMLSAVSRLFGACAVYFEAQGLYEYFRKNQVLPDISAKDLLLIDDLGAEPAMFNEYGQARYPLAELLLSRYKTNSTTVIATNCSVEQIGQIYGERLLDRMRETYAVIPYLEPSYRGG